VRKSRKAKGDSYGVSKGVSRGVSVSFGETVVNDHGIGVSRSMSVSQGHSISSMTITAVAKGTARKGVK
jgi:hypothetical protein